LALDQGQQNKEAAYLTAKLQNPDFISPTGTQTVIYGSGLDQAAFDKAQQDYQHWKSISDPWTLEHGPFPLGNKYGPRPEDFTLGDPTKVTVKQQFSPEQQAIFDASNVAKLRLSQLAGKGAETAGGVVGSPLDFSQIDDATSRYYNPLMARATEDYERNKEEENSKLVAAGHRVGSKGYDDRMALLERQYTDAKNQAYLSGRKQAIAEALLERQTPLNEVTALLSGSQVSNPFAINPYGTNAQVGAAPIFGAGQARWDAASDIYNQEAAQAANLQQGLFSLGGPAMMAMAMSDRRLKSSIARISTHPLGIGVYEYDIDGRRERGVMADELLMVKPSAVMMGHDGYLRVDYSQIGGRP
jgi:hypothetical protein